MIRSMFLALGMFLILLSAELTMVQEFNASWHKSESAATQSSGTALRWTHVRVPRFLPYSTLCGGVVLCIYAYQLPKRWKERMDGGEG